MNGVILCCLTLPLTAGAEPRTVSEADVLSTLRPGHPRLIVLDDDLARVKRLIRVRFRKRVERTLAESVGEPGKWVRP